MNIVCLEWNKVSCVLLQKRKVGVQGCVGNQEDFVIEFIIQDIGTWKPRDEDKTILLNDDIEAISIARFSLHQSPQSHVQALEQVGLQGGICFCCHYLTSLMPSALK